MDKYINFTDYSMADIVLILTGTLLWIVAYFYIIRNAIRNKFVEMPAPAAASNLSWEFVWGFLLFTDLGMLFQWGLRIWFFMDVFIFLLVLKYGAKQMFNSITEKNFKWIEITLLAFWVPIFYYFYHEGYDTGMGAISAYMITIIMATLFNIFFLNSKYKQFYSMEVAVLKGIGNTLMSVFVFIHYEGMIFLKIMTIAVFILNLIYVLLIRHYKTQSHVE